MLGTQITSQNVNEEGSRVVCALTLDMGLLALRDDGRAL
jgi:hypothetical protein